jgi:hypothetical protein
MRILMVFVDGVGIGSNDPDANPFMRAQLDTIAALLDSSTALVEPVTRSTARATLAPLDATLGMPGLPQSGTGQAALLTGINAAREFGRHFGPWVPTMLRERLANENILTKAKLSGRAVAFANAYPEELFGSVAAPPNRDRTKGPVSDPLRAGPPIAALGAGVLDRHTPQLARGDAIASEITNEGWRKYLKRTDLPVVTAAEAGRNLGRVAAQNDLTLFAHYATDSIGHTGHMWEAVEALQKIDEFLAGILAAVPDDTLIAVVSDHGNIEDVRRGHTLNPALALFIGHQHERFARDVHSLTDVTPLLLSILSEV